MGSGINPGAFDPLQTVGAFFNDSPHPDGDVRVFLQFTEFGIVAVSEGTGIEIIEAQRAGRFFDQGIPLVVVEEPPLEVE